jgi:sugar lactone lactonase YvrE
VKRWSVIVGIMAAVRTVGRAEPLGDVSARLGEGPRWDAARGRLLWVDIEGGAVHVREGDGTERRVACGAMVGAVAPWAGEVVLAALTDALAAIDLASGDVRPLMAVPHAEPGLRCNDGLCDPAGRFWIGTMALDERPGVGALYRFGTDATLVRVLDGVSLSNGLGWWGERMYFIDTPTGRVDVLDYDAASGDVSGRRPFAVIDEADGVPDGLAVDDEGGVWVALHGGGEVRRFSPDGVAEARVEVPEPGSTACAFGGADGRTLFVTGRSGLYVVADAGVSGPPATPYWGALPAS